MYAKIETGEVSLTATIAEVFGKLVLAVRPSDASPSYAIGALEARDSREFRGFAERQNSLRLVGYLELCS